MTQAGNTAARPPEGWDHSTRPEFFTYYADKHTRPAALQAFVAMRDLVMRFVDPTHRQLNVLDVGCGAGAQSMVWAGMGHRVRGLDVSNELLEVAKQRAREAGHDIDFRMGSATQMPWTAASMDVCLALELLEHVADWEACLNELTRVLRPGGLLLLSTTNVLCPIQQEYALPLYSWYPRPLKRHYERLAATTRPELAAYAIYPAVNWFTFYQLRDSLRARGFHCLDRFDMMDLRSKGRLASNVVSAIRLLPPLRWLAHVVTPYTIVLAIKDDGLRRRV